MASYLLAIMVKYWKSSDVATMCCFMIVEQSAPEVRVSGMVFSNNGVYSVFVGFVTYLCSSSNVCV